MKVIFLDIDGVLNYQEFGGLHRGGIGVSEEKIKLLKHIVDNTGAIIVLTSTWKMHWEKDKSNQHPDGVYLDTLFANEGLEICDKTPLSVSERGRGIHQYITDNKVDEWVVLDDEVFPDFAEFCIMPHLVKSSFYKEGLTYTLAEKAIDILNNGVSNGNIN